MGCDLSESAAVTCCIAVSSAVFIIVSFSLSSLTSCARLLKSALNFSMFSSLTLGSGVCTGSAQVVTMSIARRDMLSILLTIAMQVEASEASLFLVSDRLLMHSQNTVSKSSAPAIRQISLGESFVLNCTSVFIVGFGRLRWLCL